MFLNIMIKKLLFLLNKKLFYEKAANLIIGNYIIYVDENNKVIDINTFTREVQTWGKKYAGDDLANVIKMINSGVDLKKATQALRQK